MGKKGKMMYVPSIVIEELDCIQHEEEIDSRSFAFEKMVKNSRRGRVSKNLDTIGPIGSPKRKKMRDPFGGIF